MNFSQLDIRTEKQRHTALIKQLHEAQTRLDESFQQACKELFTEIKKEVQQLPNALEVEFELSNNQTLSIKKQYVCVDIRILDNGTFYVSSSRARLEGKGKNAKMIFYHVYETPEGVPLYVNTAPVMELAKCLPSIMEYIRGYWQHPVTQGQIYDIDDEWIL